MNRKTSLLIVHLATSGIMSVLLPGIVFAEKTPFEGPSLTVDGELIVPERFISQPILSEIELGIGYVSDDAYKFGRYNGMQTQGAFIVGDATIRQFDEDGRFFSIRGTNLGLESRYLRLEGGLQGSHKFFLEYDELPNYKNNTVTTPFAGIGSNNLTLPTGFDITNMSGDLKSFELKTKRERIKVGAMFVPKEQWKFKVDFNHENKQGVDASGAAIASGRMQIIGNTTTSLLPEPIDQDTDIVGARLSFSGDNTQVDIKYEISIFDNNNDSLSWQNPHPEPALASGPAPASGSMSLDPDNEFHQLSLVAGYTLPYRTRLTGLLSIGRMTRNQDFVPYTINPALTTSSLPANSLNGEVWLTNAQLKLSSRPVNKLRLSAELLHNERDNRTPVNTYDYVVLDSHTSTISRDNRPYSYKKNHFKLDANYRFNTITSLRGGYKYNEMDRDYTDAERENTHENTLHAKWKIKAHSNVDVALLAETSKRTGSEYNTPVGENLAMRKYNLADRDRTKLGAVIDYMATDKLFLSARVDYNKDDYTNSTIGLTEATQPVYTVDFSYQAAHNITTYGYYTYEDIQSTQISNDVSPTLAISNWEASFKDTFDTIGLGAKLTSLGKWDVGADFTYSKSDGVIDMSDINAPGPAIVQYPDTRTELHSAKLWSSYHYNKQLSYKLGYWYERYSADNWAVDGLVPYDPTVEGILLLGNETLDYDVSVITLSANYRF